MYISFTGFDIQEFSRDTTSLCFIEEFNANL